MCVVSYKHCAATRLKERSSVDYQIASAPQPHHLRGLGDALNDFSFAAFVVTGGFAVGVSGFGVDRDFT